jgi:hypothetical protein
VQQAILAAPAVAWVFAKLQIAHMGSIIDFLAKHASRRISFDRLPHVWPAGRQSIYRFLETFPVDQALPSIVPTLPDEDNFNAGHSEIRWAAGARDGVFGHHLPSSGEEDDAKAIFYAIAAVCRAPTHGRLEHLYAALLKEGALQSVDALLTLIAKSAIDRARVFAVAQWLTIESPDREPLKFGIALSGLFSASPIEPLLSIGRHDEFTLYVAIALSNIIGENECDVTLWRLAKLVHGWGRIQIVERLVDTQNANIKAWMLREGFRNWVMDEYLAYACAVAGDLKSALVADAPDDALLLGAGGIIEALINGGPAEDLRQYDDGVDVVRMYLDHLVKQAPRNLAHLSVTIAIKTFAEDASLKWANYEAKGWTSNVRIDLANRAEQILMQDGWRALVAADLATGDDTAFWLAAKVAPSLGIDPWEMRFERQRAGTSKQWYFLMQTEISSRASRVVELARAQLDPPALATGPADELGLGPEFSKHSDLQFLVQELRRFPGLGWDLISSGLKSPVISNRNQSVRALSEWGETRWPVAARGELEAAESAEPNDELRLAIRRVLNGQPFELPTKM